MNIIAGWIMPEMNWARKLDAYSSSLCSAKVSDRLLLPAEDLDQRMAGEHLLDVTVELAGGAPTAATNCGCDRLPIRVVDPDRQRHGDQRDERQQRRDPEHHRRARR